MTFTKSPKNIALIVVAIVVLVAAGAFLVGPPPDKGPSTSAEALEASEAETILVDDPVHNRPFEVSVWKPAAEVDKGKLVVISHGFSGDRTSHATLAQGLATQGFTVAAPTHPDIAGLESGDPGLDPFVLRPRHLSLTIDSVTESSDFSSVTLVGHSLGGYSALRMAGASPSIGTDFTNHCDETGDEFLCSERIESRIEAEGVSADFTDTRIDNIVLLAPGYGPLFDSANLDTGVPVAVVAASDDSELPGDQVGQLVDRLPANTSSTTVPGGHYVFMRSCTEAEAEAVPAICDDPEGADRAAVTDELVTLVTDLAETS